MSYHRRYKLRDDRFGLLALALRERARLTQAEVATALGVSERTIRHWEAGTAYPATANLKDLIELYWQHYAFAPGKEREEIKAFWKQATESAAHRPVLFDEAWAEELLSRQRVLQRLKRPRRQGEQDTQAPSFLHRTDWGNAVDVTTFYGREQELLTLKQWVEEGERCRVIVLLGMGGIGKTTLSIRFAQEMTPHFGFVLWRSLRNLPPLEELLNDCIQTLSEQEAPAFSHKLEKTIASLIELLRKRRCLLILDNAESLLQPGNLQSDYRKRYAGYGLFIEQIATATHQSCLLLTSREMVETLEALEGSDAAVRVLKLSGLGERASQELLAHKNLSGTSQDWKQLIRSYSGNPLALKIVGATVRDLFGGDIAAFVREGLVLPHTLEQLLDQQFARLAPLERDILYWLAIERDVVPLETLRADLPGALASTEILTALQALRRRCLVERGEKGASFTLQPEVMTYVSTQLVRQVSEEIIHASPHVLVSHALLKAQSSDEVRESQRHVLIQPLLKRLLLRAGSEQAVERQLRVLVRSFQEKPAELHGYAGGNLVNLLATLKGHLKHFDFSALAIRQGYFRGIEAQDTNLSGSSLAEAVFMEPIESIASLALSPDGAYLAVGSFSGHIRIWHVAERQALLSIKAHERMVWALAFSPDSTMLASGGYDKVVKLWQMPGNRAQGGRCLATLPGHERWVRTLAFHPDGTLLASAGDDETIRLWDIQTKACLKILFGQRGTIWSIAFTPDGSRLISGDFEATVGVWDREQGVCLDILHGHQGMIMAVACHPSGAFFASGDENGLIRLWDAQEHQCLATMQLPTTKAASLAFNQEGDLLAAGSQDGAVEIWHLAEKQAPTRLRTLPGHPLWVSAVAFGPHNFLASISYGGKVKLWDGESGRSLGTLQGYSRVICAINFSPDSRLLACGDDHGMLRIWDVQSGQCYRAFKAHTGRIWSVVFSPDGKSLASGGDDQVIKIWKVEKDQEEAPGQALRVLRGHTTLAWSVVFSPDGKLLASGGFERPVKLWRIEERESEADLKRLEAHTAFVWSVAFSPDGSLLASGDNHGMIVVWDVETGQRLATLQNGHNPICALVFPHDSQTLLSSDTLESITLWHIGQDGSSQRVPDNQNHINWTRALAFNQDGTMLAVGSDQHTIRIWHREENSGTYAQRILSQQGGQVWAVAFSPDSRLLASGDDDGMLVLWDTQAGNCVQVFRSDRPYERMNIQGVKGLSPAQRSSLRILGATEKDAR